MGLRLLKEQGESRELNNVEQGEALHLPVIMAVGIRLGSISHSLLIYQAIKAPG
jgi:dethiobiotin synthetase